MKTDNPYLDIPAKLDCHQVLANLGYPVEKKVGKIRSPFRDERTPSFSIFREGAKWKDHATGEHGDIFDIYTMVKGGTRADALRELASMAGLELANDDGGLPIPPRRNKRMGRKIDLPDFVDSDYADDRREDALRDLQGQRGVLWNLLVVKKGINPAFVDSLIREGSLGSTGTSHKDDGNLNRRELLYMMERGVKMRPAEGTSHRDFWVEGIGSANLFRGSALIGNDRAFETPKHAKWPVIITEGETDCMVAADLTEGEMKAFWVGGLGASWVPDTRVARRYFRGRRVYIIGDHDKAGFDFGVRLQEHLITNAGITYCARFNWGACGLEAPGGCDLGDFLQPGPTREGNLSRLIFSLRQKQSWV